MKELLFNVTDNIWAILLLFVLIFLLVSVLVTKNDFKKYLLACFRIIISLFLSPLYFYKNTIMQTLNYGSTDEKQLASSTQYLLRKSLTFIQLFLIFIVILISAEGLVMSWLTLIPPKQLRDSISQLEIKISENQIKKNKILSELKVLNDYWSSKGDSLISAHKEELNNIIASTDTINKMIVANKDTLSPSGKKTLMEIVNYTKQYMNTKHEWRITQVHKNSHQMIEKNVKKVEDKFILKTYVENWAKHVRTKNVLATFDLHEFRNSIQPDYYELDDTYNRVSSFLESSQNSLNALKNMAKYDIMGFFKSIILTLLQIIITIWVIGIIFESISIGVEIAENIRKIRQNKDEE